MLSEEGKFNLKKYVMGLVFTYPVSLAEWVETGLFDREKKIYEEHLKQGHFSKVIWFSFGTEDKVIRDHLVEEGRLDSRIDVIGAPAWAKNKLFKLLYSHLLPHIRRIDCCQLDVIKTNQMNGAWVASAISAKYGIPFELRTGYTISKFKEKELKDTQNLVTLVKGAFWFKRYRTLEQKYYKMCDIAVVSSKGDKEYLCNRYGLKSTKIQLLTNYIDCSRFANRELLSSREKRFLFVGRLSEQKNLKNLIRAFSQMELGLDLYGAGELEDELRELAADVSANVVFKGRVKNEELPEIYNRYKYFILPSFYEGMPKTLLEAMACGCICFGTDVAGIQELIEDGNTGFLISNTSAEEIRKKVMMSLEDHLNIDKVGINASEYIQKNHSLGEIVKKEYELIAKTMDYQES